MLLSPDSNWKSRFFLIAGELIVPLLTFLLIFIYIEQPWQDWVLAFLLVFIFSWLGIAIGFLFGFKSEKSINNFCNAIVWILGFGPGPFMGVETKSYQFIFPGAQALQGNYFGEAIKLIIYVLAALVLSSLSVQPRNYRFFAK